MVKFGERLKAARTAKHMSQQALADVIGKSLNTVGLYERGLRQPSLETLCLLADTLEVSSDYLLARNMELGMRSGQYDLVSYVIASIATLCEGELLQSDRAERMEITRDAYLEIIYKKTASLLGISAGVGALSAGANREQVARMRRFGDALGMAFQIQDDLLNLVGSEESTKKDFRNDITEGKRTTTCANTRSRCRCCCCSTVPTRRGATSCSPCWHAAARTKRRSTPCNRPSRSREACRRRRK